MGNNWRSRSSIFFSALNSIRTQFEAIPSLVHTLLRNPRTHPKTFLTEKWVGKARKFESNSCLQQKNLKNNHCQKDFNLFTLRKVGIIYYSFALLFYLAILKSVVEINNKKFISYCWRQSSSNIGVTSLYLVISHKMRLLSWLGCWHNYTEWAKTLKTWVGQT